MKTGEDHDWDGAAYTPLGNTCHLVTPFLPGQTLVPLLAVCRDLRQSVTPLWRRYQMWLAPSDAAVLRRSHALDDLAARIAQRRPCILQHRIDMLRRLRAMNHVLRQGTWCRNSACRVPIARDTDRCDTCFHWRCTSCGTFRAPGTYHAPCIDCGYETLHPCGQCRLRIPRDRQLCNECRLA
jgi:hypothetical protein